MSTQKEYLPETSTQKTNIYIIKSLKEISQAGFRYSMKCGNGFTNENCVGDFHDNTNKITKKKNIVIVLIITVTQIVF